MKQISKITIVEKFGSNILNYINILREQSSPSMDDPDVKYVFSTVHKFKGLEMDHVILLDDFKFWQIPYQPFNSEILRGEARDEINLLYVALTRAKKSLVMNPALFFLLTSTTVNDCMETLVKAPEEEFKCIRCLQTVPSMSSVVLQQAEVLICNAKKRVGSYLCTRCCCMSVRRINHKMDTVNPNTIQIQRITSPNNARLWRTSWRNSSKMELILIWSMRKVEQP